MNTIHELSVDTSRGETISINVSTGPPAQCARRCVPQGADRCCRPQIDVTFPQFPCAWISLDAMDVSGDLHLDVVGGLRVGA